MNYSVRENGLPASRRAAKRRISRSSREQYTPGVLRQRVKLRLSEGETEVLPEGRHEKIEPGLREPGSLVWRW
jgi:hypothetical protein